jgi:hypothetical protein
MTDFLKYSVRFENNQGGIVDRKHVADPPGYEPSASREVVRATPPVKTCLTRLTFLVSLLDRIWCSGKLPDIDIV